jgi:hypothetical protein
VGRSWRGAGRPPGAPPRSLPPRAGLAVSPADRPGFLLSPPSAAGYHRPPSRRRIPPRLYAELAFRLAAAELDEYMAETDYCGNGEPAGPLTAEATDAAGGTLRITVTPPEAPVTPRPAASTREPIALCLRAVPCMDVVIVRSWARVDARFGRLAVAGSPIASRCRF